MPPVQCILGRQKKLLHLMNFTVVFCFLLPRMHCKMSKIPFFRFYENMLKQKSRAFILTLSWGSSEKILLLNFLIVCLNLSISIN